MARYCCPHLHSWVYYLLPEVSGTLLLSALAFMGLLSLAGGEWHVIAVRTNITLSSSKAVFSKLHMCICMCACDSMRAFVDACVRACVFVGAYNNNTEESN